MPSKDAHLKQACHNFSLFQSFDKTQYPDWAATILFYTALHYVDAFLAIHDQNPGSHVMRDRYIRTVNQLRPLYQSYCFMKNQSHNARYAPPTSFTPQDINDLEAIHLKKIRVSLHPLL